MCLDPDLRASACDVHRRPLYASTRHDYRKQSGKAQSCGCGYGILRHLISLCLFFFCRYVTQEEQNYSLMVSGQEVCVCKGVGGGLGGGGERGVWEGGKAEREGETQRREAKLRERGRDTEEGGEAKRERERHRGGRRS